MILTKSEIKKAVTSHIKAKYADVFECRKNWLGGEISFFRETAYGHDLVHTVYSTNNSFDIGNALLSHTRVEEILDKVLPNSFTKENGVYPSTIKASDNRQDGSVFEQPYSAWNSIQTDADLKNSLDTLDQYINEVALPFFNKYSDLNKVLERIDELDRENRYWHEIIFGGPNYFFRGLIISKLCNDKGFKEKKDKVDSFVFDQQYNLDEYHEPYKRLIDYLETV